MLGFGEDGAEVCFDGDVCVVVDMMIVMSGVSEECLDLKESE